MLGPPWLGEILSLHYPLSQTQTFMIIYDFIYVFAHLLLSISLQHHTHTHTFTHLLTHSLMEAPGGPRSGSFGLHDIVSA